MYNYYEEVKASIMNYLTLNDKVSRCLAQLDTRHEKVCYLHDTLWDCNEVTGNYHDTYTFDYNEAKDYVYSNIELLMEAVDCFCCDDSDFRRCLTEPEHGDVLIRLYVLDNCIHNVFDEMGIE